MSAKTDDAEDATLDLLHRPSGDVVEPTPGGEVRTKGREQTEPQGFLTQGLDAVGVEVREGALLRASVFELPCAAGALASKLAAATSAHGSALSSPRSPCALLSSAVGNRISGTTPRCCVLSPVTR